MREFSLGTRIFFGEGALERLRRVKGRRVLIVTDGPVARSGIVGRVAVHLDECDVTIFDGVVPDPPIDIVARGVEALRDSRAEVMIAVGGGSTIDAAKAIRAVAARVLPEDAHILECFAIPTTSGTGSEVTDYSVITGADGTKYPLGSGDLHPPTAILAPELTASAPPSVTADSGMDALTHAVEACVAHGASDLSDAFCEKAAALLFAWLPRAVAGDDLARERTQSAACMAGLAFNSAGLGLAHGIAHAIGSRFHIPHGRACALALPSVVEYNARDEMTRLGLRRLADRIRPPRAGDERPSERYARLARAIGLSVPTPIHAGPALARAIRELRAAVGIPATLRECGVDADAAEREIPALASRALADITTASNPNAVSQRSVETLLRGVLG